MTRLLAAIWEFVAGEDPIVALGVVGALGATALLQAVGAAAWWVMPLAVIALLGLSLRRAVHSRK